MSLFLLVTTTFTVGVFDFQPIINQQSKIMLSVLNVIFPLIWSLLLRQNCKTVNACLVSEEVKVKGGA